MLAEFGAEVSEPQIHRFIKNWVILLADGKYQEAYNSVLRTNYQNWTPQLMEQVINGYGVPYEIGQPKFAVTHPETALGVGDGFDVMWFDHQPSMDSNEAIKRLAEIWYQLPLNNEWSDLTVTFELVKCSDGFHLELGDIHVH